MYNMDFRSKYILSSSVILLSISPRIDSTDLFQCLHYFIPSVWSRSGVLSCDSKLIIGNFARTNDVLHMQLVFMHSSSVESFDVELHGWIVGRTKKLNCGCGWGAHIRHVRYNYSHGAIRKGAYRPEWSMGENSLWCDLLHGSGCYMPIPIISTIIWLHLMMKWRAIHLVSD